MHIKADTDSLTRQLEKLCDPLRELKRVSVRRSQETSGLTRGRSRPGSQPGIRNSKKMLAKNWTLIFSKNNMEKVLAWSFVLSSVHKVFTFKLLHLMNSKTLEKPSRCIAFLLRFFEDFYLKNC